MLRRVMTSSVQRIELYYIWIYYSFGGFAIDARECGSSVRYTDIKRNYRSCFTTLQRNLFNSCNQAALMWLKFLRLSSFKIITFVPTQFSVFHCYNQSLTSIVNNVGQWRLFTKFSFLIIRPKKSVYRQYRHFNGLPITEIIS